MCVGSQCVRVFDGDSAEASPVQCALTLIDIYGRGLVRCIAVVH